MKEAEETLGKLADAPDPFFGPKRHLTWLSDVCEQNGEYEHGLVMIREALKANPDTYNYWLAGKLAARADRFDEARSYLDAIGNRIKGLDESKTPDEAWGDRRFYYNLKGVISFETGHLEAAIGDFSESLKFVGNTDAPLFATCLGEAQLASGRIAEASRTLERVLSLNPNFGPALLFYGKALIAAQDPQGAKTILGRLERLGEKADPGYQKKIELDKLVAGLESPAGGR